MNKHFPSGADMAAALAEFGVPHNPRLIVAANGAIADSMSKVSAINVVKLVALAYHAGAGKVSRDETKQFGLI